MVSPSWPLIGSLVCIPCSEYKTGPRAQHSRFLIETDARGCILAGKHGMTGLPAVRARCASRGSSCHGNKEAKATNQKNAIPRAGAMRQGAYLIYREHCTVLPINWYAPLAHSPVCRATPEPSRIGLYLMLCQLVGWLRPRHTMQDFSRLQISQRSGRCWLHRTSFFVFRNLVFSPAELCAEFV